jgi:hypothetical protein
VIVLRYLLDYTPGEIAELLELPRGTVNSRLRRGLDNLKDRLRDLPGSTRAGGRRAGVGGRPGGLRDAGAGRLAAQARPAARRRGPRCSRDRRGAESARPLRRPVVPKGRRRRRARAGALLSPGSGAAARDQPPGRLAVRADGSKRLLGRYRDAIFSPHGLYIAAVRANELVALDTRETCAGRSPARARAPTWTGTRTDTRIAYVSGGRLRVVAGDGTGDHAVAPAASVGPAWRPVAAGCSPTRAGPGDRPRRRLGCRPASTPAADSDEAGLVRRRPALARLHPPAAGLRRPGRVVLATIPRTRPPTATRPSPRPRTGWS